MAVQTSVPETRFVESDSAAALSESLSVEGIVIWICAPRSRDRGGGVLTGLAIESALRMLRWPVMQSPRQLDSDERQSQIQDDRSSVGETSWTGTSLPLGISDVQAGVEARPVQVFLGTDSDTCRDQNTRYR